MTSQDIIKKLREIGFVEIARRGSHVIFQHPKHTQRITVPIHTKKQLPPSTVRTIQKIVVEAGIADEKDLNSDI